MTLHIEKKNEPLLRVEGLRTTVRRGKQVVSAIEDVSLTVGPGEVVAVVGETGSGKSMTALSIMQLLHEPVRLAAGTVDLDGKRMTDLSPAQIRAIRGSGVGMVFQDAMTALNPYMTVGAQLAEAITLHRSVPRRQLRDTAVELLTEVGIVNPRLRVRQYPHELSGGTQQRVMIAMALANRPGLLIADEPTTGLDATVQAQILVLIKELADTRGMGVLIITHDLGVVAGVSDRTVVMYAGQVVESGPTDVVLSACRHPYTRALLQATPRLAGGTERLAAIPGSPPELFRMPSGCRFHPRCPVAQDTCRTNMPALETDGSEQVRCWFPQEGSLVTAVAEPAPVAPAAPSETVVALHAEDVHRHFGTGWGKAPTRAVDGITVDVRLGETLGIVGESGCGKSTFAKILAGLDQPTEGTLTRPGGTAAGRRAERSFVQFVFQDTFGSLDPRRTVAQSIGEPLRDLTDRSAADRKAAVLATMASCGLPASLADRYPHELSGGQRQRVGICRALVTRPDVVVMDEPMSGLDVSVQAQIVNLLQDLRSGYGLTGVIVSHDVGVIRHLCDRVAVMYLGRIVEIGPADEVLGRPRHPYTAALVSAVPLPDPEAEASRRPILLKGEVGDVGSGTGCPFAPRCPAATDRCRSEEPLLRAVDSEVSAACHFPGVLDAALTA